jgi:hypothetical protein
MNMDKMYTKNPKDVQFWRDKLKESGSNLSRYIDELRNHVTDTSKRKDSFYLYFHWRVVDERSFYNLELGVVGLVHFYKDTLRDPVNQYIYSCLCEELEKNAKRFKECKFFNFFTLSLGFFISDLWYEYQGFQIIPIREFLGNYEQSLNELLPRVYTVRYNTPRRVKEKVFRRGYDDKGSESSVSEKARRRANQTEFPYLTTDFLEYLREHPDPISLLRSLGFLLPLEE